MATHDPTEPQASATLPSVHSDTAVLPNLDGIRAVACLLVVVSHMPLPIRSITLGETGVGVFFVLSGFLMSYLYGLAPWDFKAVCRYSIARFARIAPIYWLVISFCVLLSYYEPNEDFSLKIIGSYNVTRHYLFGGNVLIFWSIPLEVQFYVFFLLIWWAIASRARQPFALPLIGLLCAGLLLTHSLWPGLTLPNKLHFFLAGAIAGVLPRDFWQRMPDWPVLACLQFAAVLFIVAPLWLYPSKPAFYAATELGVALAVAIYLFSIPSRWTTLVLASPLLRRIGQGSFSIYLMHLLVFHYGMRWLELSHGVYDPLWLLLGVAGVALPMLASRYVEIPLQRLTRHSLEAMLLPMIQAGRAKGIRLPDQPRTE